MTEQTVCLRPRRLHKSRHQPVKGFQIVVPAHLAPDFGLSPQGRVIQCDRPPQVATMAR